MTNLTIIKVGSTVDVLIPHRGDFEDWFCTGLGVLLQDTAVVSPHLGDALPEASSLEAVVVTGSPAMVTDELDWSLACERLIADLVARGVPVLGVCYGHQLLARAMGGQAGDNPGGREIGTCEVALTPAGLVDSLFEGLPQTLVVQESHSQSVLDLPAGAVHLGRNAHGALQAFRVGERAWGVQFHPEFDADIMRSYVEERAADLSNEGLDPELVSAAVRESGHGLRILQNFVRICSS